MSELGGKETVVGVASTKCRVLNVIDDDGRAVVDLLPVGWIVVEGVHGGCWRIRSFLKDILEANEASDLKFCSQYFGGKSEA